MRSLSRAVVASALALPLTVAGAGIASADPGKDDGHKGHHHKGDKVTKYDKDSKMKWDWGWKWTQLNVSDDDKAVINAGIIG